eukprot:6823653-Pyramimonas_sp.AAC.1
MRERDISSTSRSFSEPFSLVCQTPNRGVKTAPSSSTALIDAGRPIRPSSASATVLARISAESLDPLSAPSSAALPRAAPA